LLLLPPSERRERPHTIRRVVHDTAVRIGRGAAELTVRVVRVGGRVLRAVERVVAESGRDAAVRIGSAASAYAAAVGRAAAGATSRGWAAAQVGVPRAGRALAAAWRSLARLAHVGSTRAWARSEPALRRLWAACLAGSRRASDETGVLAHSASKRLSAFIDSRTGRRQG
jgi:hypothetical protein